MASELGPVAIATAVNDNGIRLYTKLADGTVTVENNTTTEKEMEAAQERKDTITLQEAKNWHRSQTTFQCDPKSGLAACWINDKDALVLLTFRNRLYFWFDSPVVGADVSKSSEKNCPFEVATSVPALEAESAFTCTPGSQLAIVTNPSHTSYILFFQDVEGYIVTRPSRGVDWESQLGPVFSTSACITKTISTLYRRWSSGTTRNGLKDTQFQPNQRL
ncbi:hypothetical protein BDY19DRAFT_650631 [Irpex rosettiformis]|uniref:Uncharacterized protein n=1 Tax=Irpex rosettiformis TaxID=378272 RepID=A0ACB8TNJ0_9APHY|nr:hypothetical protein BDY19DRAFT_650631 [Irpex rosettiformis]